MSNDLRFSLIIISLFKYLKLDSILKVFVVLAFSFILVSIEDNLSSAITFSSLIAIGIVTMIGLQAIINIAVVTNTIPVTGMPLPFFSYGGTAIIIDLVAVGVLLNISRHCNQK